jgi:hypothetical protein
MKEELKFKKRRRISRPMPLIIAGVIFLIIPFLNYLIISYQMQIPLAFPLLILSTLSPLQVGLLFAPILVGIGLLSVRKWGYFVFIGYSAILILHNLFMFAASPLLYNLGALTQTFLGTAIILYFIRKDISAPYMHMYPRGWRLEIRKPIVIDVRISEKAMKSLDFSLSGFFVSWDQCPYQISDEILVEFDLGNEKFKMQSGIVRIDDKGVGIAFRNMNLETKKRFANCLKDIYRFS